MARVVIVEPSPAWPVAFRELAAALRAAIGDGGVRIDHIGSTAVAGLAAKPVIDVQVGVGSPADLDPVAARAVGVGFTLGAPDRDHVPAGATGRPVGWRKRFLYRRGGPDLDAHVHVRVTGNPNWRYALLFRDYLRATPPAAETYGHAKRALAALPGVDGGAYADAKDPIADLVLTAAELWATNTGWSPPAADA